jgi:hypothetical protein
MCSVYEPTSFHIPANSSRFARDYYEQVCSFAAVFSTIIFHLILELHFYAEDDGCLRFGKSLFARQLTFGIDRELTFGGFEEEFAIKKLN